MQLWAVSIVARCYNLQPAMMHCDELESVYESFYKLNTKPFRLSPDPEFFYPSAGHKRALSYLLYGLNQAEGFVVITGAPGTGKTTLAHKLLSQIDAQNVVVAHLASTQIEAEDLLRLVASCFKLRSENVSKAALLKDIESFLLGRARERKRCLLVVDEAQNLPPRSIEELRMLSNFQVGNKALLQVFLLGQQQFRGMLDSPDFEQLRQRVIADYHLQSLDAGDSRRYIESRLQHAGWQNDPEIDAGAHAMIFEYTGGLPRRINMFCDRLFLFGYLESLHMITHATVCTVIAELNDETVPRSSNIVFTPAEQTEDAVAAPRARAPEPTIASIVPPPLPLDFSIPPENPLPTIQPVMNNMAVPQPDTPPVVVAQRPPKHEEPVFDKTADMSSTPSLRDALRDVSDANMADFLLTTSLRKASITGSSSRPPLNTLDEPPHKLSSSPPSLAGAETRWIWIIASACVVLAILAFWFFPSIHEAFQRMQSPEANNRAPLPSDVTQTSTGLAQQITDPSENVLTENRILAAPLTAPADKPISTATELPTGSIDSAGIASMESNPPAEGVTGSQVDTHSIEPKSPPPAPEENISAKPKPGSSSRQHADASTPPGDAKHAPTSASHGEANAAVHSSASGITRGELTLLVTKFARYYEEGNLPKFLGLFDEQVRTEDSNTIDAIRNDYAGLFQKTARRQMLLGDIHWENSGRLAQGMGFIEVRVNASEGVPPSSLKGDITFHVEKKDNNIVITGLYHTLH